ncbi:hypothetical protein D8674_024597 [Pyrus ussuriensis x Pyrus communis]|uniref:Uncharacterized protein n=1 Tax=Pyrus ussuriensis x Pyrus communis TaxID=2448454 RepID=A0A5N5H3D2_9ROSA|nr:hypothetical protein D8674_024597 [Pyrus ussuriensis x Pyrus communis]
MFSILRFCCCLTDLSSIVLELVISRSQFLVPHGFRLALQRLNHRNDHSSGLYFDCILSVFVSVSVYTGSLIPAASVLVKPQKTPEVNFLKVVLLLGFAAQKIKLSRNRNSGVPVTLETVGDICVAIKGFTNEQKAIENGIPSEWLIFVAVIELSYKFRLNAGAILKLVLQLMNVKMYRSEKMEDLSSKPSPQTAPSARRSSLSNLA